MIYRKEFDGLRAIAVIAVIMYHLNKMYLPNGFLGVDIFLVLSGFLITSIIQESLKRKKFDIFLFWQKRFFRIYPAYFTVICLTLIAAYMLLPKASIDIVKNSAIYSLLGIPNFFYYRNISESYFDLNAMYPLLHLWSLGLELQFYFAWSILLLIGDKFKINLGYLVILLSLSSFIMAIYFYSHPATISFLGRDFLLGKKFVFYLLPTRLWEFGIGALASIYMIHFEKLRANHLFSTLGIVITLIALCLIKGVDEFSPYLALLPCVGIFLFMTCCAESHFFYKILARKEVVAIGIGSYSLYLWHFPLIEFFKYFYQPYDLMLQVATLISIALLAIVSYRLVESYYRNVKSLLSFPKYGACIVFLVLFSYIYNQKELNSNFYKFTSDFPGSCLYQPGNNNINNFDKKRCTVGKDLYTPNILLVGSSHSNSFVPFLSEFAKQYGFSFINITANSTGYTKEYLLGKAFEHDQDRVKLHSTFYKLISGMESNFDILITCPSWADSQQKIFAETLESWSHKFKMVVLINNIPNPVQFKLLRPLMQKEARFNSDNYSTFLKNEAKKYDNVFFVSFNDLILESKGLDNQKHSLFFDAGHLNIGGSLYLAKKIIQDKNNPINISIFKSSKFLDIAKSKNLKTV